MNRNEDQLISKFMKANKQELADNGFSRKVMHRLPETHRAKVWSDILTAIGVVASVILFIASDGIIVLMDALHSMFRHQTLDILSKNIQMPTLLIAGIALAYWGIYQVCNNKE